MNREKGEGVPDFVLMDQLTEDALMDNLKLRYSKDKVYTYIGEVVVSVNPYKKIEKLYSPAAINEYKGRNMYEVPPHIYSLSNDVYSNMMRTHRNQCVIISGESGAGKTEASKIFMQYIAAVSKSSTEVDRVKNQLLESNPVLEAFGNSKTLRNDNSSRFGKYMEIQFEHNGAPVGGKITNYLLEKSRVVIRAKEERSFHIFYQLLAGATDQELTQLKLQRDPAKYTYLKLSECFKVDTINDPTDFKHVLKAMGVLGFSKEDQLGVWKVISAILHLGNVTFAETPGKVGQAKVQNPDVVEIVAGLLDIPLGSMLLQVLTSRSITTGVGKRSSHISIPLDVNAASFTRDALAKSIYERLFIWVVDFINASLNCKTPGEKLVIGVLDIYGFEIFQNNSFEQFSINLCNEKLQQLFIELTLKSEQEEYVREGIEWEPIQYFNNKVICDLIEGDKADKKGISIISLMDECGLIGESTDATLLERLIKSFGKHPHFETFATNKDRSIPDHCFKLKHYAGDVVYNVNGFLEKNKDTLFGDLVSCLQGSNSKFVQSLFSSFDIHSKKRPLTAGTQFRNALAALMEKLLACVPHYIRCIKPNEQKKADRLDEALVRHQVRYLGLVENVRVRRAGFAYRMQYDRFVWRYKMICKDTWPSGKGTQDTAKKIMETYVPDKKEYRLGKTKIFIRNPTTLFKLEELREAALPRIITKMQAHFRGFIARKNWKRRKAAVKIQSTWRGAMARSKWSKRKAAMKILLKYRKYRANKWLKDVQKTFSAVKTDPKFGKNVAWPKAPGVLKQAETLLKKMRHTWGCYRLLKTLKDKDEEEEMRQKVLAYDIFHGKKPWNCARRFEADYLQLDSNPLKAKYIAGMQSLFQVYGDSQVLFADYADKINSKSKAQRRALVVTDKSIYKQDPKNYKVKKCEIPLSQIEAICLSPHSDTFVVVQAKEPYRDLLADLGASGSEKYAEFVSVVALQVQKLTERNIANEVKFTDNIKYNNGRTAKSPGTNCTLTFQSDPKATGASFKSGKNNANIIMYK